MIKTHIINNKSYTFITFSLKNKVNKTNVFKVMEFFMKNHIPVIFETRIENGKINYFINKNDGMLQLTDCTIIIVDGNRFFARNKALYRCFC